MKIRINENYSTLLFGQTIFGKISGKIEFGECSCVFSPVLRNLQKFKNTPDNGKFIGEKSTQNVSDK